MFTEYGCKECGKDRKLYSIQRLGGKTPTAVRSVRERSKQTDASVCCLGGLVIISLQCICFGFFSTQTGALLGCFRGLVIISLQCICFGFFSTQTGVLLGCFRGLVIISLQCICFGFFSIQTGALLGCFRGLVIISLQCICFMLRILTSNNSPDLIELPFHYFSIPTPAPPHLCHN